MDPNHQSPNQPGRHAAHDHEKDEVTSALTPGMLAFYASCTVFGVAAAVAAVAFIVLPDMVPRSAGLAHGVGWFAVVICALSFVGSWYFLSVTRRQHGDER